MSLRSFRSSTVWIVPLVLLMVALFEEILTYKIRQHVRGIHARAAIVFALNAFAFGVAAGWLSPKLRGLLKEARKGSRKTGGTIGLWAFYLLGYGALYYAFVILERSGPGGLLPAALR